MRNSCPLASVTGVHSSLSKQVTEFAEDELRGGCGGGVKGPSKLQEQWGPRERLSVGVHGAGGTSRCVLSV
jgi:hypothetical protein